ncbi:hypothetical protein PG989_014186 [Apiospora arundinis]
MIEQKKSKPTLPGVQDIEKANAPEIDSFNESTLPPSDTPDLARSTLPLSKGKSIALVATVTGAAFLNTLSIQAVVIILPTLGRELNIPDSRLQWVVSAYSLAFGCFLLLWGRIADLYGKRIIFILGSAFVAATLIANPFLPNEIAFDVFRGLQGLGAAANVPTAIGILGVTFPPGKAKNYAFSAYGCGAPLGSIFGNLLGGIIASYANWKWVFGALAGISLVVAVAGYFFIPPQPPNPFVQEHNASLWKSVDWFGGFLITAGLLALLFALTEGNVVGWQTIWIYMLMVIAGLLIAMFVAWQWYLETHSNTRSPLMKVSIFKSGMFSLAMLIMGIFFAVFNDWIVYATYFFQDYQGLSPLQTTLRFIPTGVCGVFVAFIVSRLISRVPTYILLMIGNFSPRPLVSALRDPHTLRHFLLRVRAPGHDPGRRRCRHHVALPDALHVGVAAAGRPGAGWGIDQRLRTTGSVDWSGYHNSGSDGHHGAGAGRPRRAIGKGPALGCSVAGRAEGRELAQFRTGNVLHCLGCFDV